MTGPIADRIDILRHVVPIKPHDRPEPWVPPGVVRLDQGCGSSRRASGRRPATPAAAGASTARCRAPLLRDEWPLPDDAQRRLDDELYSGRLSGRGATRVQRLAWTVADLADVDRTGPGRGRHRAPAPLGDPAADRHRREARRMNDSERLARVALSTPDRAGRPADGRAGRGARRGPGPRAPRRRARRGRSPHRRRRRGSARSTRRATSSARSGWASGSWSPATRSGRGGSTTSWPSSRSQHRGGAPLGLWVRGPVGLHELEASVRRRRARARPPATAPRWRRASPPTSPQPARRWSPVPRSASTRLPTVARWPWTDRRWPCSPAVPTAPTRWPTSRSSTTSPATGAVVSEAPPGCAPTRIRFLAATG